MKNQEIRNAIRSAGVRQWQVAEAMGLREDTLSRKLRHELNEETKRKVLAAVEKAKAENN